MEHGALLHRRRGRLGQNVTTKQENDDITAVTKDGAEAARRPLPEARPIRDEDDLSTDRWPQVQRSSGILQAVKPPIIDLPPLPQSTSEDSLLAPLPPIMPRAESAAPLPDLDSPFEQRLARGSGPHPSYLGLPGQTQVTPRL